MDEVSIDFNFAKDLHIYDVVSVDCLTSETKTGKELISLLLHTELVFILDKRQWYNTDDLSLLFAVTFDGYEDLIIEKLKRGESVGQS